MNENSKTIVALLTGLAAGTALGFLLAPEKGEELRSKLSESLKNLGGSVKSTVTTGFDNFVIFKDQLVDDIRVKMFGDEEEYQDDLEHA